MLTVDEAFAKFKGRLEITDSEADDASARHKRIRQVVGDAIDVDHHFLTGSYARHTKTKPLKDVDIFVVLGEDAKAWRDDPPLSVLKEIKQILDEEFGSHRVEIARRSARVDFGVSIVDDVSDKIVSFDVVPAFEEDNHFVIPDRILGDWMASDPRIHAAEATAANKAFDLKWKPVVKMIKKWNDHNGKPVKPSFLIEVMALKLIVGPWTGSYPYELKGFFATASEAVSDVWPDPAGLGEPVSDRLDNDSALMATAKTALRSAEQACTEALRLAAAGRSGNALAAWQNLFGPLFAKS
ncbi:MAG: CBASS oligonucleotide cyclase [Acidimicrobiales bacterium]|jgi:predicted nucleotidyltransferase